MYWQGTFQIWQNRDFGELYAKFNNQKLYLLDDLQLFISRRPLIGNTTLYLYCTPPSEDWIVKLKSLAKELRVVKIWIYSVEPLVNLNKFLKGESLTLVIDLRNDKETLWKKISSKTRNMIRKGTNMKVTVKIAEKREFEQWWKIYFCFRST